MLETGVRVRLRNDPSRIGEIIGSQEIRGRRYQHLRLQVGGESFVPDSQLELLPDQPDALADFRTGRWSSPADLGRVLTHVRLTGRLADLIYSMEATNTEFHAYQFKPVVKLLGADTRGLLIADEVGLGKTIEAGLVWTELVARFDARRLLVVCPKSLGPKWRAELQGKFAVRAREEDAAGLIELLSDPSSRADGFAAVCSLSSLRPPRGWEETTPGERASARLARLLSDTAGQEPLFDLVVFDEAHHLRNAGTAQHRLAQLVVDAADHKLLLTATPINLHSEDLRTLLRLLDPDLFEREWVFDQLQRENEPLVAARTAALDLSLPLSEVARIIGALTSGDLLKTGNRLEVLRRQAEASPGEDGPALRAELASRLEEMSMLGAVVNRTRRRDVIEIQVVRRASVRTWTMSDEERAFYDEATAAITEYASSLALSERFLLSTPQRLIASSLPAAYAHWRAQVADSGLDEDSDDERPGHGPGPLVGILGALCQDDERLRRLTEGDRKFDLLRRSLDETRATAPGDKLIVFSSFRRTVDYLWTRLRACGLPCERLHGSIDEDRQAVLSRFADADGPVVLLASEIGSEGLDLQFCSRLINYDLPWNPMRVEQRIGRIDRIGQSAPSVEIFSLVCEGTIEQRVYQRLYERLKLIERTLGGFEIILGPIIAGLERRLLDPSLTLEEQGEEINRASVAIETQRVQQDTLEQEAAGLIAHGDMILHRIRQAHDQQRWIGGEDLAVYVEQALRGAFPATRLERAPTVEPLYDLRFSADAALAFRRFVDENGRRSLTELRAETTDARRIAFGRNPDPRRFRRLEVVTNGHPLVRFSAGLRAKANAGAEPRPAIGARVPAAETALPPGLYALAIQHWSVSGATEQVRLKTAGVALPSAAPIAETEAEQLLAVLTAAPREPLAVLSDALRDAAVAVENALIGGVLAEARHDFISFESAEHIDKHETRLAVLHRQREASERRAQARIADLQARGRTRIIPAEHGKLQRLLARMDARIAATEQSAAFSFSDPATLGVALVEVF